VLDYWLARCEGFELTTAAGRQLGTVEEVVLDDSGRARALVVRGALLGRRRVVATEAIETVVPAGETFTLRSPPRARHRPPIGRAIARSSSVAARALHTAAIRTSPRIRAALGLLVRVGAVSGARALAAAASASRWGSARVRRHVPALARRALIVTRAGARWTWPRLVHVAGLAVAVLVGLVLFLFAIVRGIVVATWTYWTIVAREAARRRAPT
jgi:hypothetical protein